VAHLDVDVVAADRTIWSGEARMVSAPSVEGDVGILPGHTPMLAVLRPGTVRITPASGGQVIRAEVEAGFLSVDADRVTVVTDTAAAGDRAGAPAGTGPAGH
jgi:F-type H+-transporting ATPase subunit epsilon